VTVVGGRLQTAHWWAKDDGRRKLSGKVRLKHVRSVRVQRVSAGAGVRGCDHNAYMDGAEYTESAVAQSQRTERWTLASRLCVEPAGLRGHPWLRAATDDEQRSPRC
jgi:hypothetical protein